MRIVFLTHNYPRHPGDVAGAFLEPLAVALGRAGHDVRVVAPSDRGRGGEEVVQGVRIRRVRYAPAAREQYAYTGTMQAAVRSPRGLTALLGLHRALRQAAREEAHGDPATVVHAHWWIPAGLAAPPERPTVLTVHGTDGMLLARSGIGRWLAGPVFRRARVITTVSSALARTVATATGLRPDRLRIQPMPVDTSGWEWSRGGGGCLVVARLTAQKRVSLVLEALGLLRRVGRTPACTIVGDGPERSTLEQLAGETEVASQVRFTGQLPAERVRQLLMEADLAVAPFKNEGFGLAAAEALMAGVPVVACEDGGGVLDIVPREHGGRVVGADPASIASAIDEMLAAPAEREAARTLGAGWRQRLAPAEVAARFAGWYREALDA